MKCRTCNTPIFSGVFHPDYNTSNKCAAYHISRATQCTLSGVKCCMEAQCRRTKCVLKESY